MSSSYYEQNPHSGRYTCTICKGNRKFRNLSAIQAHLRDKHKIINLENEKEWVPKDDAKEKEATRQIIMAAQDPSPYTFRYDRDTRATDAEHIPECKCYFCERENQAIKEVEQAKVVSWQEYIQQGYLKDLHTAEERIKRLCRSDKNAATI